MKLTLNSIKNYSVQKLFSKPVQLEINYTSLLKLLYGAFKTKVNHFLHHEEHMPVQKKRMGEADNTINYAGIFGAKQSVTCFHKIISLCQYFVSLSLSYFIIPPPHDLLKFVIDYYF